MIGLLPSYPSYWPWPTMLGWFQGSSYPSDLISQKELQGEGTAGIYARGLSVVPGAIVCADHSSVASFFELYLSYYQEASLASPQRELLAGKAGPAPVPEDYGCVLIPPGTPMRGKMVGWMPVVTIMMPDGIILKGVTLEGMFSPYRPE